ncbi:MAG: hypothetical protein WDZ59_05555 [Pirellulales bacterium]
MGRRTVLMLLTMLPLLVASAPADEVRYFEQNGQTIRETRRVVQRPVVSTSTEQREQLVYRQQITSETRDQVRTVQTPVVEYQWVPRMYGRWNPFSQPYIVHEQVPITRWETRTEIVETPVTRSEWVPERRVVDVPVTMQRLANTEVIERVAVGPATSGTAVASRQAVGGVARLESDPPREASGWRSADGTVRR